MHTKMRLYFKLLLNSAEIPLNGHLDCEKPQASNPASVSIASKTSIFIFQEHFTKFTECVRECVSIKTSLNVQQVHDLMYVQFGQCRPFAARTEAQWMGSNTQ